MHGSAAQRIRFAKRRHWRQRQAESRDDRQQQSGGAQACIIGRFRCAIPGLAFVK